MIRGERLMGHVREHLESSGPRRGVAQVLESEALRRITERFGARHGNTGPTDRGEDVEDGFGDLPPGLGVLDVMELSLDALQEVVTRYRLASYPPDLVITIPRHACRTLDFHRGAEMIALGRHHAEAALVDWSSDARAPRGGGRPAPG